ncbi:hypothetical protein HHI36_003379 [Cryptolaemus montrouzieri]|uniref:Lipase n=1 Tax=Cryptolaemus montrouzieri TaxID=559131 RepID=A0ABD2PEP9_9CUCU
MTTKEECDRITNYVKEKIIDFGYPLEVHSVVTEDGYINSMFRIPHGKLGPIEISERFPVLLVHGLLASCADFVNEEKGLGYFLADAGYDVWIANCRGTTFSREHISLDCFKNRKEYWDFSWHEIGYYDIPAMIDYVLSITSRSKLFYVGHSQGVTAFMVLLSSKPKYNEKIILCCGLAPVAIFNRARIFPLKIFSYCILLIQDFLNFFSIKITELPGTSMVRRFLRQGKNNSIMRVLCLSYLSLTSGHANKPQAETMDLTQIGITTTNTASWRQVIHYSQVVKSDVFSNYDHGKSRNKEKYGTESLSAYDLSRVSAPVALFYGKNDLNYHEDDVNTLAGKLGNVVLKHAVDLDLFNHLDFLYAKDSIPLLYNHITNIMKKYK